MNNFNHLDEFGREARVACICALVINKRPPEGIFCPAAAGKKLIGVAAGRAPTAPASQVHPIIGHFLLVVKKNFRLGAVSHGLGAGKEGKS